MINHDPKCTNKNCEGGVITTDGQTGRLCMKCNPKPWKIKMDPYMNEIYDEGGREGGHEGGHAAVNAAGYFVDSTTAPHDIDYMLQIPTTPIAMVVKGLNYAKQLGLKPVVLLSAGSFNPPHPGHFEMMEAAKTAIIKKGEFPVAGFVSPGHDEYIRHKSGDQAIPIHKRIQLCEEMAPKWISVDPWEGIFNGHAIMFTHVVKRLELYLERHIGVKIPVYFVCGGDNLDFMKAFQKQGHCVVVGRPGMPTNNIIELQDTELDFTYAHGSNPMSSTKIRESIGVPTVEKVNLHLRVEDTMFDSIGADWEELLGIVQKEYSEITISKLSDQLLDFDDLKKAGKILSLDPFMVGDCNLRLSRYYDLFGSQMLKFHRSPEADPVDAQLNCIRDASDEGFFLFDDDIHTTGGTMRYVSGLLDEKKLKNRGAMAFKVSDDSQGEILDLRDFLIHSDNCGLVIQMPDGSGVRTPYVYPYVCPFARAQVTDPLEFSIKIWEYNKKYHTEMRTRAKDLGSMGELFAYAGMVKSDEELVADVCERHIQLLKKLKKT